MEGLPTECAGSTPQLLVTQGFGGSVVESPTLDKQDVGTDEDSDTNSGIDDSIWSSTRNAVNHTNAGGIVNVFGRGIYRDDTATSLPDSITIRGANDADVILAPDCANTPAHAFGVSVTSGETVILENLTLMGWTTAIDASGMTAAT